MSRIDEVQGKNFIERTAFRKQLNDKKHPETIYWATDQLWDIYFDWHDITLLVYRAQKDKTIIDIQYSLASSLPKHPWHRTPTLHAKVSLPPYRKLHQDTTVPDYEKFDINWEHGGWTHRWKMFWRRIDMRRSLKKRY